MLAFQRPLMDLKWRRTGADGRRFSRTREPGDQPTLTATRPVALPTTMA